MVLYNLSQLQIGICCNFTVFSRNRQASNRNLLQICNIFRIERIILCLGVIHVLAVEGHDVVEHALGLDSWAVGVKLYSANIVVNGFMPLAAFASLVSKFVELLCSHL